MQFPEGLIAVVKRDCPTCLLVDPILKSIESRGLSVTVYVQDDPTFSSNSHVIDDRGLEYSFRLGIETVPTLIRITDGREAARAVGWQRAEWEALTGLAALAPELPAYRPGCGSVSVEPGIAERLAVRYGTRTMQARRIEVPPLEDEFEWCFERGWSDGLPLVPPTEERVYRMLTGTTRDPNEILGAMPPNLSPCSVEKVAINAVMAGCKPEYLPVVLAAVEAALDPVFCLHGLLATTWFSAPMIIVNGPVREAIGMNWQGNVLGQGNRANATIGRALQLVVRNVGGGKPLEADQSTFGTPAKYTFCFAEDENTPWTTLAEDHGISRERSSVTLFSADGPLGCLDQKSRAPAGLIYSLAGSLRGINHIDIANAADVVIVIGPEHGRVFDEAGWSKAEVVAALHEHLQIPAQDLGMGTDKALVSVADVPPTMPKFRHGGLSLVRAGGAAGLFSAIIPGWLMKGSLGTDPVTKEITP
ncbi:MAG: thioredoxin [Gammaproteobacteria bacterium]|nr:thioredoxin [Gammaproteobacteria bacterium]